jgi:hypothetical protein
MQMRRQGSALLFNEENWGLGGEDLPETIIDGTVA